MKIVLSFLLSAFVLGASAQVTYNEKESLEAIAYLNRIRVNPKAYEDSTETASIKYAKPKPVLTIDPILMKVARKRAEDMATRNYFDHVNPEGEGVNWLMHGMGYNLEERYVKKKSFNSFESIAAGYATGIENINTLILDKGQDPPAHRQHLLSMTEFWSDCTDVGAALVHNPKSKYKYYFVIVIAKH